MQANAILHGIMPERITKLAFVIDDEKHSESKVNLDALKPLTQTLNPFIVIPLERPTFLLHWTQGASTDTLQSLMSSGAEFPLFVCF